HGLMLVGGTMSGKSSLLQVLAKSLTRLANIAIQAEQEAKKAQAIAAKSKGKQLAANEAAAKEAAEKSRIARENVLGSNANDSSRASGGIVEVMVINPKSITSDQLYGADDPNTHEWTDGVLPVVMRKAAAASERTTGS